MKNNTIKIYCLCDPITCKVRYIGRTSKPDINTRLIEHISKAKYFSKNNPGKKMNYKIAWINSLLNKNTIPKIRLLTKIEGWKESHKLERFLINKYKDKFNLVNLEDRGEGGKNKIVTKEQKLKISNTLKEYYKKNGITIHPACKKTYVYDYDGNFLKEFDTRVQAAEFCNTTKKQISKCFSNKPPYPKKHVNKFRFSNEKFDKLPEIQIKLPFL